MLYSFTVLCEGQTSVVLDDRKKKIGIHSGFPENYYIELFFFYPISLQSICCNFPTYKVSFHCKMNIHMIAQGWMTQQLHIILFENNLSVELFYWSVQCNHKNITMLWRDIKCNKLSSQALLILSPYFR